jgi:hypothetical protein
LTGAQLELDPDYLEPHRSTSRHATAKSRRMLQGDGPAQSHTAASSEALLARAAALEAEGKLAEASRELHAANRVLSDPSLERRLVGLRRAAFTALEREKPPPPLPAAAPAPATDPAIGLPVARPEELSAELIRSAIAGHGSLIVRGVIGSERVERLRAAIDEAFGARAAIEAGARTELSARWYDEVEDIPNQAGRSFTSHGGVLAADSPRGFFEMLDAFYALGIDELVAGYLRERPALSFEKSTLRLVPPNDWPAAWHQDGAFLGANIRSLNVWTALSRCGRDAPGLQIVPKRFERILPTGGYFDWDVSDANVEKACPDLPPVAPEFEPGDMMFFDHLTVHRTSQLPGMTQNRYAIEAWFFSPSAYPHESTGLFV